MTFARVDTHAVKQEGGVCDKLLRSFATDAVDDGIHAAKRAIKSLRRGVEEFGDLKEEALHRVKRQPFKAAGVALGVGLVLGVAAGWTGWRLLGHRA